MKRTFVARLLAYGFYEGTRHNITAAERLGKKSHLLKCCGAVHQVEAEFRDVDGWSQWRGMNDYICVKCHRRGRLE